MSGVILIHPPAISKRYLQTKFMPYGMGVLYAFLKARGVPVAQYDFLMDYLYDDPEAIDFHNRENSFTENDFFGVLEGRGPGHEGLCGFAGKYGSMLPSDGKIYAFSIIAYHQFWASLLLARHIKRVNHQAVVVFGGPFITIRPIESFVVYGQADYWIRGNGETPLLRLYQACLPAPDEEKIGRIPGIVYIRDGAVIRNPRSRCSAEEEPPPDFEGLDRERYTYDHPEAGAGALFLPYRTSKGCPTGCSFCTGRLVDRYSTKSARKIVNELSFLSERYRTKAFMFTDASVNGNESLLSDVCESIADTIPGARWYAYARMEGCSPRLLERMRKAGCFSLFWGVESASPPTIRLLGKRFRVERMSEIIDASAALGIRNYIHLIYNTPHETTEDVKRFLGLVKRYCDNEQVVFVPHRFLLEARSRMCEHPRHYGLRDIRRFQTTVFEREQYLYEEEGGITHEIVRKRNEEHRRMLEPCLARIETRNSRDAVIREQM
jgi:radical SAM superfamily enzyme YgiQ (UPF0313 family)